jgi:hypothetical protein
MDLQQNGNSINKYKLVQTCENDKRKEPKIGVASNQPSIQFIFSHFLIQQTIYNKPIKK